MSLEHSPAREAKNGHTGNIGRMLISDVETARLLGCWRSRKRCLGQSIRMWR